MQPNSIQRRLIATVVLSQSLLTAGLVLTGVLYTYWRLLSTLDTSMQARALSLAALVRYHDNATGDVYFDETMVPPSIDAARPDVFAACAHRCGQFGSACPHGEVCFARSWEGSRATADVGRAGGARLHPGLGIAAAGRGGTNRGNRARGPVDERDPGAFAALFRSATGFSGQ